MEETEGIRHQDTMKRALSTISKVSNIPMRLVSWIRDLVQLDSDGVFAPPLPTSLRRLLEDEEEEENDIVNMLENTTLESWTLTNVDDIFAAASVDGSPKKVS